MANSIAKPRTILLLHIINGLDEGKKPDKWKVHKTTFLTEAQMQTEQMGGLDYEFIKDKDGPMSPGIYDDIDLLIKAGFVTRDFTPKITEDGKEFLASLDVLFDSNKEIISVVDDVLDAVKDKSGADLRKITHDMEIEIRHEKVKIDKLAPYTKLLRPLPEALKKKKFVLSDDIKESIDILSVRESRKALKSTFKHTAKSNFVTIDQVFR